MKRLSEHKDCRPGAFCTRLAAISLLLVPFSCAQPEEEFNWVDLRYKVNDSYELTAADPAPIKFQVKSTDPWVVYSYHKDDNWCTITPDTGDDPEKIYDVEVQYADNTGLDDRVDTLVIQSDYWIGKWVKVTQKGTAFLNYASTEEILLPRSNGKHTYEVQANQKWTAKVTEGSDWLSVSDPASGEGNGSFTVTALDNNGAMRTAVITLLDRHDVAQATVNCKQDGVQLEIDPAQSLIRTDYVAKSFNIPVESNTSWSVQLEDEQDSWLTFVQTSFENDAELQFSVSENDTRAPREAVIIARTSGGEGSIVVEQRITVKQAHKPYAEHYEFTEEFFPAGNGTTGWQFDGGVELVDSDLVANYSGSNTRIFRYNRPVGKYVLKINPMEAASKSGFFFKADYIEFRFHLNQETGMTEISNNKNIKGINNVSFDPSVPHELGFEYTKGNVSSGKTLSNVIYYMDGQKLGELKDVNVAWESPITLYIGSLKGKVVYDWMEYTAPVSVDDL